MDTIALRSRRSLTVWVVLLLLLLAANRLAVVLIAVNGRENLLSHLLTDAVAVTLLFYIAFSGRRAVRWLGALLLGVCGLVSLSMAVWLEGATTFSLRGEPIVLIAVGTWGVVVRVLGMLTGAACLGFAGVLAGSRSVTRYFAYRRDQNT